LDVEAELVWTEELMRRQDRHITDSDFADDSDVN